MSLYRYRALANGLRTDHPIPDLPFVDDSDIPVDDPGGIQAIGRRSEAGTWGREDTVPGAGWLAYTTDQTRRDLAWCVRWHPDHGRSVVVYSASEAAEVHMASWGPALLFRSGGYWWDGTTWYRPAQVWDSARENYFQRPVPAATTVTAADLLNGRANADQAAVLDITDVRPDASPPERWIDHLALWAARRDGTGSLDRCVVKLAAPELTGDQLLGVAELAETAGVAASTLRAYIARGEGDVPLPQATIGRSSVWALPVAEEWAEQRRRSADGVTGSVAVNRSETSVPVGLADVTDRFARNFFNRMSNRRWRKRWTQRWRTDAAIRELAHALGSDVAGSLDQIIPIQDLSVTVRHAVLEDIATQQRIVERGGQAGANSYPITPHIARMLDWLVRHYPSTAAHTIGHIVGEAERELEIPRETTERSIREALLWDSELDEQALADFFDRVLSPQ